VEKFEYEFIEIVRSKLSDLDPAYAEEMEKLRRSMRWRRRTTRAKR
jgi:hypothetical protein